MRKEFNFDLRSLTKYIMKKLYSLFAALLVAATATAQLQTEVESAGIFKLTYGAANDYTIYEPGFEVPTFYVHCWINGGDNSTGGTFEDAWSNSTVTMNWDAAANAYVGMINLNTKTFTQTNAVIPSGTTVEKVGMVFKDLQNGANKQSGDLAAVGTTTTTTTMGVSTANAAAKSTISNGKLITAQKGILTISVFDMSGKLVKNFTTTANGNAIDLNVADSGVYLVKITAGATTEVVKFIK